MARPPVTGWCSPMASPARKKAPGRATYRPAGLAVGPDGALYVSEDMKGRIWRITHLEGAATAIAAAPAPVPVAAAGITLASLTVPPGSSEEQLAQGDRIFHGRAAGGTCAACHGADGGGSQIGANLSDARGCGATAASRASRARSRKAWPQPSSRSGVMPPLGAAPLQPADVDAVAAYVWALSHRK